MKEKFDIKELYTPLSVAKEEIWKRWNNKELKKKVEDFLEPKKLPRFLDKPKVVLFRYIATPNLETELAWDISKLTNLEFIFAEYLNDKFCTVNHDKVCLGKMYFFRKKKW